MKTIIHRADSRGHFHHGWLDTHHTFSFAGYYNPERIHFGVLRVLNDDTIEPGMGFGTHPHENMEIITIPIEGDLQHRDSMGNSSVISHGEIQVMSAGTGIQHSEFNPNGDQQVSLLQIWIFPHTRNVEPRYGQMSLSQIHKENELYQILSPDPNDEGLWIYQDAWFSLGALDPDISLGYKLKNPENGVYVFIIAGSAEIAGTVLEERDGMGVTETREIGIRALTSARILLMEVPMHS